MKDIELIREIYFELTENSYPGASEDHYAKLVAHVTALIEDQRPTVLVDESIQPLTYLEIGDYFPFIDIGGRELYTFVDSKFFLFICVNDISDIDDQVLYTLQSRYNVFTVYNSNTSHKALPAAVKNSDIYNLEFLFLLFYYLNKTNIN